jgi:hypothetical protein
VVRSFFSITRARKFFGLFIGSSGSGTHESEEKSDSGHSEKEQKLSAKKNRPQGCGTELGTREREGEENCTTGSNERQKNSAPARGENWSVGGNWFQELASVKKI